MDFGKIAFCKFYNSGKDEKAEHRIVEKVAAEDVAYAKTGLVKHKGGRNAGKKFRKRGYCGKKDSAEERTGKRGRFIKHIHIFGSFDGHKGYYCRNDNIKQINHFKVSVLFVIFLGVCGFIMPFFTLGIPMDFIIKCYKLSSGLFIIKNC